MDWTIWIHNACTDIIDIWDMHVQRNTVEISTLNMNFFCEAHYFNTPGWPFWSRMNCKTESIHLYRISRRTPKNTSHCQMHTFVHSEQFTRRVPQMPLVRGHFLAWISVFPSLVCCPNGIEGAHGLYLWTTDRQTVCSSSMPSLI